MNPMQLRVPSRVSRFVRPRGSRVGALARVLPVACLLAACSSGSSSSSTPSGDGGADGASGMVTERGRVLDYGSGQPLPGVTITDGNATTTTGADGRWSIRVPANTPVSPFLSLSGYVHVHLGEESYAADSDRTDIPIPDFNTYQLGEYAQPGYDETKASVSIALHALPPCASDEGATLTVTSPPGTSTLYFNGGFPSKSQAAVKAGETPAITVYNIPVGNDLVFTLNHPTCKQMPFPVTVGTTTYTGKVTFEAGKANSVLVIFLQ